MRTFRPNKGVMLCREGNRHGCHITPGVMVGEVRAELMLRGRASGRIP